VGGINSSPTPILFNKTISTGPRFAIPGTRFHRPPWKPQLQSRYSRGSCSREGLSTGDFPSTSLSTHYAQSFSIWYRGKSLFLHHASQYLSVEQNESLKLVVQWPFSCRQTRRTNESYIPHLSLVSKFGNRSWQVLYRRDTRLVYLATLLAYDFPWDRTTRRDSGHRSGRT
jgi:hypothetical protein